MLKQLFATAPGQITSREYEERPLMQSQVRIKSEFSAEKHGTMLPSYKGLTSFGEKGWDREFQLFLPQRKGTSIFPMPLGNITVGTVVEVGEKVTRFKVGEKVYGYLPIRETNTVEEKRVDPAPSGLTDEHIVCLDPAGVALMSVREAHLRLGDEVAVFGLGAIGLFAVQMAKLAGATLIIGVDPVSERRKLAKKYGADLTIDPTVSDVGLEIKRATKKRGVDVAIEVSGSYKALQQAVRGTGYGGMIVPVSFYHGEAKDLNLGEEWHFNRHTMVSGARVESEPYRDYPRWDRKRVDKTVVELFQKKNLTVDNLLYTVDFDDVLGAYRTLDEHPERWIKLAIKYKKERK